MTIRSVPVAAAGIYAPGGRAFYPSSVLMCAIPARVAGVERVALASPPGPDGELHPIVLAAAALAGSMRSTRWAAPRRSSRSPTGPRRWHPSNVIAGPGNAWVQDAKREVQGLVGIDSYAGPSELMVIAGHDADAEWIALDLCAQAEHGDESPLLLATVEQHVLDAVEAAVTAAASSRPSVSDAPLALVRVPDAEAAIDLANAFAPEHLELVEEDAALLADRVQTAGCVFARPLRGDRLRRLRRRLQPRPADRRGRPLLGPARPRHLPPQDLDGRDSARGGGEACPARRGDLRRRGIPRPRRVGDD